MTPQSFHFSSVEKVPLMVGKNQVKFGFHRDIGSEFTSSLRHYSVIYSTLIFLSILANTNQTFWVLINLFCTQIRYQHV